MTPASVRKYKNPAGKLSLKDWASPTENPRVGTLGGRHRGCRARRPPTPTPFDSVTARPALATIRHSNINKWLFLTATERSSVSYPAQLSKIVMRYLKVHRMRHARRSIYAVVMLLIGLLNTMLRLNPSRIRFHLCRPSAKAIPRTSSSSVRVDMASFCQRLQMILYCISACAGNSCRICNGHAPVFATQFENLDG